MKAGSDAERVERFLEASRRNQAVSHGALEPGEAVAAVCARVAEVAGGAPVAVPSADPLLERIGMIGALEAAEVPLVRPDDAGWREAIERCPVGVTGSAAAIAETGTVALACGPGVPRAVSLLPDTHVCLVDAETIHERFEDALPAVVAGGVPPNLVWVSGPSRSADIEKQITLGVHGPRTVEIVVVSSPASAPPSHA